MEITRWLNRYRVPITLGFAIGILIVLGLFGAATLNGYERGDFFALFQLVVDILMIPITVFGLLFVVHEFHKSQRKPDVDLFWNSNFPEASPSYTKETLLRLPKRDTTAARFELVLVNTGNSLARWYSVEIWFPKTLGQPILHAVQPDKPTARYWSVQDARYRYTFRSEGVNVLYLGHPFVLTEGHISMRPDGNYEEQYEVRYVIVSDWGKPAAGTLMMRVVHPQE